MIPAEEHLSMPALSLGDPSLDPAILGHSHKICATNLFRYFKLLKLLKRIILNDDIFSRPSPSYHECAQIDATVNAIA